MSPEPENGAPAPQAPKLPPKILDQLGPAFIEQPPPPPRRPPTPDDTTEVVPSPPETPGGPRHLPAVLVIVLLVAGVAILVTFSGRGSFRRAAEGARKAPGTPAAETPADGVKPRFEIPVPTETELAAVAGLIPQHTLLRQLDRHLAAAASDGDQGLKPLIGRASLSVVDAKQGLPDAVLRSLDKTERPIVTAYQNMFSRIGQNLGRTGDREADARVLEQVFDRMALEIDAMTPMEISKIVLCLRASGFGTYEPFFENRFPVQALPLILVYAEIAHVNPRLQANGRYVVKFKEEFSLLDDTPEHNEVWKQDPLAVADESMSRKRDFFVAHYLRLPKTIAPGKYHVRARITDLDSGAVAVATTPLVIVAQ